MKKTHLLRLILYFFFALNTAVVWAQKPLNLSLGPMQFIDHIQANSAVEQKLLDEAHLNADHCTHCPQHLNLAADMMTILEKLNSPRARGIQTLEDSRLKFLYYTVKHQLPDGQERCQRYGSIDHLHTRFHADELSLISDKILDLPYLSEVVIAPFRDNQTVYTFRGEGAEKDLLMELIISKDGQARLRTYQYKSEQDQRLEQLPRLDIPERSQDRPLSWNNHLVTVAIDPNARSLKSDETSLIANENRSNLSQDINNMGRENPAKQNKATQITITENEGRPWMLVSAQSSSDLTSHELVTAAPMSVMLDEKSGLHLNTTLKNEVQLARTEETIALDHAQGASMDLSTNQHRLVGVEVYQRESNNYNRIAVFNNFEVAAGSSIGSRFETDNHGNQVLSLTNTTQMTNNSRLQLEAGQRNSEVFMTVRSEHQLTDRTSLSIGAANSESRKNEFVLQFKMQF